MSKERKESEIKPFLEMDERRIELTKIIEVRSVLTTRIGEGEVKTTSSLEDAIKVGRVRNRVLESVNRIQKKLIGLDEKMEDKVDIYVDLLGRREKQMAEMKDWVKKGILKVEEVQVWMDEFSRLTALPDTNSGLKKGLEKINVKEIPLIPELKPVVSKDIHKFDNEVTVGFKAREALLVEESRRTLEQKQLLTDLETFEAFVDSNNYQEVYTPEELQILVGRFKQLFNRDRRVINEVGKKILDVISDKSDIAPVSFKSLKGFIERSENENQRGMQWDSLNEFAKKGIECIQNKLDNDYWIDVNDPNRNKNLDLSPVYQFIADQGALEIMGQRINRGLAINRKNFMENYQIIEKWFHQNERLITRIPLKKMIRVDKQSASIQLHIRNLVEKMNWMKKYLEGEIPKGIPNSCKCNLVRAIEYQEKIAERIKEINMILAETN